MSKDKTIKGVLFKHIIGVIIIVLVYWVAGYLVKDTNNVIANWLFNFFNANIALLIGIIILELLAEIFETLRFPFNLPFPLFRAFAVTAAVSFLFILIEDAISVYDLILALTITSFAVHVYRIIFVVVLIVSSFNLFKGRDKVKEKIVIKEVIKESKDEKENSGEHT